MGNYYKDRAKKVLKHYFNLSIGNLDCDSITEIEDIVDNIINAVKEEEKPKSTIEVSMSIQEYEELKEYKEKYEGIVRSINYLDVGKRFDGDKVEIDVEYVDVEDFLKEYIVGHEDNIGYEFEDENIAFNWIKEQD